MQNPSSFYHHRAGAGLGWLMRSIDATKGQGSSHIFARWRYPPSGWHLGYPETTGYIIETLLDYVPDFPQLPLREYAMNSVDWLLTQQLDNGAFPALLAGSQKPSIFNSGMIVFGLLYAEQIASDKHRKSALEKLRSWLHTIPDERIILLEPTYISRALWAFYLLADDHFDDVLKDKINRISQSIFHGRNEHGGYDNWGFDRKYTAFTHTIAYTLRGFLEMGTLLNDKEYLQMVADAMEKLRIDRKKRNKLAGSYNGRWQGNYSFRCVTGHAQLSIISFRLFQLTNDIKWLDFGRCLFEDIIADQKLNPIDSQLHGAVPGSKPVWGPYMGGKYPNWSVKFYLDALRLYVRLT